MTAAGTPEISEHGLDLAAAELAAQHALIDGPPRAIASWTGIERMHDWLSRARSEFGEPEPHVAKAAEWLLDNEYLVHRAILQVREDLPAGFYRELPALAGVAGDGVPRVVDLARHLLEDSVLELSFSAVARYVGAYQEHAALTTAELWALPTVLRLGCLEVLAAAVERLVPSLAAPFDLPSTLAPPLEDTDCVARALGSLRVISSISWKDFFEASSRVQGALLRDPAGVYPQMDFETTDRYRKVVERLSRATSHSELEVAERVVAYATRFAASDPRLGHVGYWLIDEGRDEFESSLGYRGPTRVRLRRWLSRHAPAVYALALSVAVVAALSLPALYLANLGASSALWVAALLTTALPASVLGVTFVHWLLTQLLVPTVLPKLDLVRGIPQEFKTAVVVPTLAGSREEAARLLEKLEGLYLGNPDPVVEFILLTDFVDATSEHTPDDDGILDDLLGGVETLNRRYEDGDTGPFHLLHRPRIYNPGQRCWMARERKRGKLEDFNRLVRGDPAPGFSQQVGASERLRAVRFVVTLDADTALPRGSLQRLVGILAHPLNRAQFDPESGCVTAGYTVVQPRVEIDPASGNRSWLARLFAGDTSIDIYSRAVSDVYQDLFGSGIYVGKGIYDVGAFAQSLDGRVPENALASHDLFEGIHGRAALATDVVLYESFPRRYLEYTRRMHRWIRGDWQLLPWIGRRVPGVQGDRLENRLGPIDRWKIVDNLRRSLVAPSLITLLAFGWLVLPGTPWLWTTLGLLAPAGHLFTDLVTGFARGRRRSAVRSTLLGFLDHAGRWLLLVAFLPYEAWVALDAIARACARMFVTKRRLLEWTTAAQTAVEFTASSGRAVEWRAMWIAPVTALVLGAAILLLRPEALPSAALLLLGWLVSPEVAYRLGLERQAVDFDLSIEDSRLLRQLARRTWLFFERFAGPDDQWLPPDNFQEDPGAIVAHRTSPTNIGMMLVSSLAAWDLGYVGSREFSTRLGNTLGTLKRLERYRGHLLNWYDTRSLQPLSPRYVSTVDSGNLAASLIAVKEGCREIADSCVLRPEQWDGLLDALSLLEADLGRLAGSEHRGGLRRSLRAIESRVQTTRDEPRHWCAVLRALGQSEVPAFERSLQRAIESAEEELDLAVLRDVRIWLERVHHHLRELDREIDDYAPWARLWEKAPPSLRDLRDELEEWLPMSVTLKEVPVRVAKARERLACLDAEAAEGEWRDAVAAALDEGEAQASRLRSELLEHGAEAELVAHAMDFSWLYDPETRLLHIGYNATADRLDSHYYDLLASEARITSLVAIAKGDAPIEHWFQLGRSVTQIAGKLGLVSWGGSMFEYLMPSLLLRSEPGTLLAQSERAAVEAQKRFGQQRGLPWGVSESGFAALDADYNYRYRAFGVPELGLRRGLAEDSVVTPHATILALGCDPEAALDNLRRLAELGLMGEYGLYEAVDFTLERVPEGREWTVVRSYMAHHQGMILAALDNALCDGALLERMSRDPHLRSVELLLHERVPAERPLERLPRVVPPEARTRRADLPSLHSWSPGREQHGKALQMLGNGRLTSAISDTGAGGLRWHDYALTRWSPDPTSDKQGLWFYAKDEDSGEQWSAVAGAAGARGGAASVVFQPHVADFYQRRDGIGLRMEVAVVAADDVEIRRFTLVNQTNRSRTISLTSYAEIVLGSAADDERHPAFSKLFVKSEWNPAMGGLLFSRRPRGPGEHPPVLLHRLVAESPAVSMLGYETDRRAFLGRGRDTQNPEGRVRSAPESTGFTLDPIASLCVEIKLEPNEVQTLAFLTVVGASGAAVAETAERYHAPNAVDWVLADAETEAARALHRIGLAGHTVPVLSRLASCLVYPQPGLRCAKDLQRENRIGQPRLWGMGISGDLPILLVKTREEDDAELLRDLVMGHRLWREKGFAVDVVVLREGPSGYAEPVAERLRDLLRDLGVPEQLSRRGGIHFVVGDQWNGDEIRLLHVAACVVLDTADGALDDQLTGRLEPRSDQPAFTPSVGTPTPEPTVGLERPDDLLFDNGFGGFSPDGREYVIHLSAGGTTPAPWTNVIANEEFGCLVTESGGGYTWAANSGENRLTPWTNDPVSDASGEALYLRDEETGVVWTPTPAPAGQHVAHEIRHGAGTSEWRSHSEGLEQQLQIFVPPDDPVKVIRLRLRNQWTRPRRITATYYAEWVLGVTRAQARDFLVPEFESSHAALLVRNPWQPEFAERVAFLTSSEAPHGITTDREEFLGVGGTLRSPDALGRWGLSGRAEPGGDPCAALQVHLELGPGETREIHFVLGQGRDRDHALDLARRWRKPDEAEAGLARNSEFWDDLLGAVQVETPDLQMNLMMNRWLLYQTVASRVFARSGFYQSGGAIGFRDQLQDMLSLVHVAPERLRAHLLSCASRQFEEGDVLHWWHPPSGRGVRTRCSDDLLWLPFATAAYVEATGDTGILDEVVSFLSGPQLGPDEAERYARFETSQASRSLFEHCERALDRGVSRGRHDLPLMGAGDWNDGMNLVGAAGVGESIWLGWFAVAAIRGFTELCELRGASVLAERWRRRMTEVERAIETHGWDGEWYRRAFDDAGNLWGSSESEECRIDSISQSWSVLSGAAPEPRARRALEAAESALVREQDGLVRLLWPPFDATLRDPGYIKAYPPGIRENGGQYTHAAAWLGLAFVGLGEPDRAMRILRLIQPIGHARTREEAERYRVEPYVVAADIAGSAPHIGLGGWTWYTGAAAWTWRLGVEGLLGIRRVPNGVRIQPCIPTSWKRAALRLRGPAGSLSISIEDPGGVGSGIAELSVDGVPVSGEVVAFPDDGKDRRVVVRLGPPSTSDN